MLRLAAASGVAALARAITGVRGIWQGSAPSDRQRIYFANHSSHGDFIILSASLPRNHRVATRPVAAADYWGNTALRRFVADTLLGAVLIERNREERKGDPLAEMIAVLDQGHSLILFPEGLRNMTEEPVLPFKSGLYNLALARPDVELVPCWLENMSRVLPKGEILPVPLLCRVIFGAPVALQPGEDRHAFLERARQSLLALAPRPEKAA
ncbi:MAG: 1-acyl-sn-glycerol-3-phosphate acyltransferase [Rhizobiaceae bacterium]|nr:1-acyl-sn-glycerol-3-phosphate acyltransferase [Rhizobiaceae bacterium]